METVHGTASILATHTSFRTDWELKCLIAWDASLGRQHGWTHYLSFPPGANTVEYSKASRSGWLTVSYIITSTPTGFKTLPEKLIFSNSHLCIISSQTWKPQKVLKKKKKGGGHGGKIFALPDDNYFLVSFPDIAKPFWWKHFLRDMGSKLRNKEISGRFSFKWHLVSLLMKGEALLHLLRSNFISSNTSV